MGQFVVLIYPKTDDMPIEEFEDGLDSVVFYHAKDSGQAWSIDLTRFTEAELDAFVQVFNDAVGEARLTIRRRDEVAENAHSAGDDSYERSYRPLPQLVYRERPVGPYSQSVQQRPQNVSQGEWGGLPGVIRGPVDGMAELDTTTGSSEDNESKAD